jgi:flavin-dependent dehydrogenase
MDAARAAATDRRTDVLIVGGGPAGSTAATLLAGRGHAVTVLEKSRHPRFHIGESLLPANLPLLEQLGVADQVRAIGMTKWAAEFVSPWHGRGETFRFADSWDKSQPFAYHVRRSEFDEILIRRAARAGAEVIEGCRATGVEFLGARAGVRIEARREDGRVESWQAKFLLDASGRDTFLGNRVVAKRRNPAHASAAMYAHFSGARRYPDRDAGNISIYWFDHGWFWLIPLADGATSVGAVVWPYYLQQRTLPVRDYFLETIKLCPPLAERLAAATLISEVEATGNYSYFCDRSHGPNYLLLGDAFAFIDPVFSSGVWLAMHSAVVGTEAVDACLREPRRAARELRHFDRVMRHGPKTVSWFIYRVSNPTMRDLFMFPRNTLRMKEALLSVLAGDIFGRTPIWWPLRAFKLLYALVSLGNPRRSLAAFRRRNANVRPLAPTRAPTL